MKIKKILICSLLIMFSIFFGMKVAKGAELMPLDTNIKDDAGIINNNKKIEDKVKEFEEKTHTDAYVYITNEKYSPLGDIDNIYNYVFFNNEEGVLIWIVLNDRSIQIRTGRDARRNITDKICERMIKSAKLNFKYERYEYGIVDILDEGIRKYENKDGTLLEKFKKTWVYALIVVIINILLRLKLIGRRIDYAYKRSLEGGSYCKRIFRRSPGGRGGFGGRGGSSGGW